MVHRCYYCNEAFESKEKLDEHLKVHARRPEDSETEDDVIDAFNQIKSGEYGRMTKTK